MIEFAIRRSGLQMDRLARRTLDAASFQVVPMWTWMPLKPLWTVSLSQAPNTGLNSCVRIINTLKIKTEGGDLKFYFSNFSFWFERKQSEFTLTPRGLPTTTNRPVWSRTIASHWTSVEGEHSRRPTTERRLESAHPFVQSQGKWAKQRRSNLNSNDRQLETGRPSRCISCYWQTSR